MTQNSKFFKKSFFKEHSWRDNLRDWRLGSFPFGLNGVNVTSVSLKGTGAAQHAHQTLLLVFIVIDTGL